jgi:hypothetical protein
VKILREALSKARIETDLAAAVAAEGGFAMTRIAETLSASRSNLYDRIAGRGKLRGPYFKANDEALLPLIRRFVDARSTDGYRQITALVDCKLGKRWRQPITSMSIGS